jgi:predicted nucleic acid-binding protein
MPLLVDSSLWIDFTRLRSSLKLKQFIAPFLADPQACIAEPIAFELLRHASAAESKQLVPQIQTLPMLATPANLWQDAIALGQKCRHKNLTVNSLDLIIATVALHHAAEIVTFDADFSDIASVSQLNVKLLKRPVP